MTDFSDAAAEDESLVDLDEDDDSLIDRMRGTGVGVEDPNIVGDAGPTDIPPGRDTPGDGLLAEPPDDA